MSEDNTLNQLRTQVDDLSRQLNQRNSDVQLLKEDLSQERQLNSELENKIKALEEQVANDKLNLDNWVKVYNVTMDMVYQVAFQMLNVYNNRRLNPIGTAEDAASVNHF